MTGTGFGEQAALWQASWARLAAPARTAVLDAAAVTTGTELLDLGCGSGELLALAAARGARVSGIDLAPQMVRLAQETAPGADVRVGDVTALQWPAASFDVVTAVNAIQFADDPAVPVAEAARVLRDDGRVAVCNWGPPDEQNMGAVTDALKALLPDPPAQRSGAVSDRGAITSLLEGAGLEVVTTGEVEVAWECADDAELLGAFEFNVRRLDVRAHADRAKITTTLLDAAAPFRTAAGGYRLANLWLFAVARRSSRAASTASS